MNFFRKISLKEIILLLVLFFINVNSIYTGKTYFFSGRTIDLSTDPIRFKIGLFMTVSMFVGYIIWVLIREEDT